MNNFCKKTILWYNIYMINFVEKIGVIYEY
ncbi:hypothetical protein DESACE_05060 [Desulfurella acetivorans A63]|nr:hypothetical protein DESACE_05060 [Desulfurella acetivorans A63]